MTHAQPMLETHPAARPCRTGAPAELIEACVERASVRVLRGRLPLRGGRARPAQATEYDAPVPKAQLETRRQACATCAEKCERHAEHDQQCRLCAQACRRCEDACSGLLEAMK
jgi:hypothetical protein